MSVDLCYSPAVLLKSFIFSQSIESVCVLALSSSPKVPSLSIFEYLPYLAVTCLIEFPAYFFGFKAADDRVARNYSKGSEFFKNSGIQRPTQALRLRFSKTVFQVILLNGFSHPWVTWFFPWLGTCLNLNLQKTIALGESFAILSEAVLLLFVYKYSLPRALLFSLLANLTSWWLGVYLSALMH